MTLPIASPWYGHYQIDDRIWCVTEPRVHPIFSANIFLVLGSDCDLVVDSGMGIAPLRPVIDDLRPDPAKPIVLFTTHSHIDHIGAAHEFDHRLVHEWEAEELANPDPGSLVSSAWSATLIDMFVEAGYPPLWPYLIDAIPHEGYNPAAYALRGAPATEFIGDGAVLDLGDWRAEVLHLPGHAAGQIGLWHAETGTLFSADALYDGPLICIEGGLGMDRGLYLETLRRLDALPITRVLGGHDGVIDRAAAQAIIARYTALWATSAG